MPRVIVQVLDSCMGKPRKRVLLNGSILYDNYKAVGFPVISAKKRL